VAEEHLKLQLQEDLEERAFEEVGNYLAAFLALEQDWGVIDGLMHARAPEEALMYYDAALRHIHRVTEELEERGRRLPYNFNEYSGVIRRKLEDSSGFRLACLKLVERALSKYPEYYRLLGG